jgi:hypothetical protein
MTSRAVPVEESVRDRRYVLRAELPGIDPIDDLRLTCTGNELRIDAMRVPPRRAGPGHSEFVYGRRLRVVPLPAGVRPGTIAGSCGRMPARAVRSGPTIRTSTSTTSRWCGSRIRRDSSTGSRPGPPSRCRGTVRCGGWHSYRAWVATRSA